MTDGADSLEENKAKPAAPVTAGEAKPDGIIADVPGKGKLAPKERRRASLRVAQAVEVLCDYDFAGHLVALWRTSVPSFYC